MKSESIREAWFIYWLPVLTCILVGIEIWIIWKIRGFI